MVDETKYQVRIQLPGIRPEFVSREYADEQTAKLTIDELRGYDGAITVQLIEIFREERYTLKEKLNGKRRKITEDEQK